MNFRYFSIILFCALLIFGCDRRNNSKANNKDSKTAHNQSGNAAQDLILDSTDLKRFMTRWAERRDYGEDIQHFYKERDYEIAWFENEKPLPHIDLFIKRLQEVELDGLSAAEYQLNTVNSIYNEAKRSKFKDEKSVADLDVILTTSFIKYAHQIYHGLTLHESGEFSWFIERSDRFHPDSLLNLVLNQPAGENEDPFILVEPQHPEYRQLREAARSYIAFSKQGNWPKLDGFKRLALGDTSDKVVRLREMLSMTGDMRTPSTTAFNPKVFDKNLDEAVKSFQTRHGLEPDGIVAGNTLKTMSVSINDRVNQIKVNMERWRIVPRKFADTFIMVNVPEFKVYVQENGKNVLDMRVVVGKEFNSTPMFMDKLEYLVFSPFWNIPKSILREEVLPAIYNDASYLSRNNMEAVKGYSNPAQVVSFWSVPWGQVGEDNFPYRIRQKPGKKNPLGLVKFIFPNQHSIYLHDTPAEHLFDKVTRAYSHGCIRISRPLDMAKYLLKDKPEWTEKRIKEAMNKGEEQYVNVTNPVQVYILYFTTWVDANGTIHFRDDIYNYDKILAKKLGLS